MQDHENEYKKLYEEIQRRLYITNDLGVKEHEEIQKNAEARPKPTGHTPNQAWKRNSRSR